MNIRTIVAITALASALWSSAVFAEQLPSAPALSAAEPADIPGAAKPAEEALLNLTRENALLHEKLKVYEGGSISSAELAARNCRRLQEVAADIRLQRQGLADFEGYVKWMSGNVAGYSKYLSAGSVAAGFAKVLPIPYAGQASVFTKFVSNAALSLSAASVSINKYLVTSQQFIVRADALDPGRGVNVRQVSELVRFADQELLKGMVEVQERLVSTSELTASSLAFLESLNHYVGSTDAYWLKTKSLLKSGDDKNEKSFLSESSSSLRNRALAFNGKFRNFNETVTRVSPQIRSLVAYDDLIRDLEPRLAGLK